MKLSVVIVNYNVEYYLEQCLHSVAKAMDTDQTEVWVVDNASVDGSAQMIKEKFPWVKLKELKENLGFSKGNNVALREAKGEYILLLNPDTVVEEDTFAKCIEFMDNHPKAGGLGVKMLDGNGHFLPESKRGIPFPKVSLYRIIGLASIFPKSEKFARYYMGHLSNNETHEIEILSGAFMFMRKAVLDKIGLLDETFFMYGEDIDLSYRIIKEGYKNYYLANTRIIHYKGESTKKGSINYVMVFYQAMLIFARKHFSTNLAKSSQLIINSAIYFRAFVAIVSRFIRRASLPILDFACILFLLVQVKVSYADFTGIYYPEKLVYRGFGLYTFVWMVSVLYARGYDKPIKLLNIIRGLVAGTIIILTAYALLPETLRFSRALILLGSAGVLIYFIASRLLLSILGIQGYTYFRSKVHRIAVVGEQEEIDRVESIIRQSGHAPVTFFAVSSKQDFDKDEYVGGLTQLVDITKVHAINEVIYCGKNLSSSQIIGSMSELDPRIQCKIAPPESLYIIGSNTVQSPGESYMLDVNSINRSDSKRNKRTLDVLIAFLLTVTLPVNLLLIKKPLYFLRNLGMVWVGKRTWVGYFEHNNLDISSLPKIKKGILHPFLIETMDYDLKIATKINVIYAKDYRLSSDLRIIFTHFRALGSN